MKSAFDRLNLRPFERRLVVGVGTVVFIVLNMVFVWPHFSDRSKALLDLEAARVLLAKFEKEVGETPEFQRKVRAIESEAEPVPAEDQGLQFLRTIQTQVTQSGVTLTGNSRETIRTNSQFFIERSQTITVVAAEQQLVDFLYNIGAAGSMIRARDLSLRPDAPRQRLGTTVKLVASYQKNTPPPAAPVPAAAAKSAAKSAEKPAARPAEKPAAKTSDKIVPPAKTEKPAAKPEQKEKPAAKPGPAADKSASSASSASGIPAPLPVPTPPRPVSPPAPSTEKRK